jgi:RimJ/RimL family protein N-acetyltransferase
MPHPQGWGIFLFGQDLKNRIKKSILEKLSCKMAHQFDTQPDHLVGDYVTLKPLRVEDFETLYAVASDPLIWEQHPNKERYKRDVFQTYFDGAIESKGAFLVLDSKTGEAIGSTRFYDYDPSKKTILIGYTFLARSHWGRKYNGDMKKLMLDHAFQFVDSIRFHVGVDNRRSQASIERFGAKKIGEIELAYYGETANPNFVFQVDREDWVYYSVINNF